MSKVKESNNYIFPNQNSISHYTHHNYSEDSRRNKLFNNKLFGKVTISKNTKFEPNFLNNSFPEIMNFYENLVLTTQWDSRENGDYETIVLGRGNMFYKTMTTNWSIDADTNSKRYQGDLIESSKNSLNPFSIFNEFYRVGVEQFIITPRFKLNIDALKENTEDVNVNLKKNLFGKNSRKISENHFAVSKINLISHNITVSKNIPNCVSTSYQKLEEEKERLAISVISSNDINDYIEKPVKDLFESMGKEIDSDNVLVQTEYMATQLIKELEMVYQGKIYILFNKDIQIGDTITLIDETTSTHGIFKILSFEHSLDERGLITILTVCASFEIREPILEAFSSKISFQLAENMRKYFGINELDSGDNFVIDKVFSTYLRFLTQTSKYCHFRYFIFEEDKEVKEAVSEYNNLSFSPTIIPLRFFPFIKKGQAQIPESLEKAFNTNMFLYQGIFERIGNFFKYKLERHIRSFGQGSYKIIRFLADSIFSMLTLNLHELFKPALGLNKRYIKESIIGNYNVYNKELKAANPYSPYSNRGPLGAKYDFTIAFFNVKLQTSKDLNDGKEIKDEQALVKVKEKENVVKRLITETFDYTFMVELYDSFKIGKDYNYNTFINNVSPEYGETMLTNSLFSNDHGNEFGAVHSKEKIIPNNHSLISNRNSVIPSENNRKFVRSIIDIYHLNLPIKKINVFWFHNLYGASNTKYDTIKARNTFITEVLNVMERFYKADPTQGYVLMGDCNLQIYNELNERTTSITPAEETNFTYILSKQHREIFKSVIKTGTTLKKDGETLNNVFDNIVVSKNLLELDGNFFYGTYEYNFADKSLISDHIPIYIAFNKKN